MDFIEAAADPNNLIPSHVAPTTHVTIEIAVIWNTGYFTSASRKGAISSLKPLHLFSQTVPAVLMTGIEMGNDQS
jgi:hypothetical protein